MHSVIRRDNRADAIFWPEKTTSDHECLALRYRRAVFQISRLLADDDRRIETSRRAAIRTRRCGVRAVFAFVFFAASVFLSLSPISASEISNDVFYGDHGGGGDSNFI